MLVLSPFKPFIAFISLRLTLPGLQGTGRGHEGTPLLPGGGILLEWWLVWWCTCVSLLLSWQRLLPLAMNIITETHFIFYCACLTKT